MSLLILAFLCMVFVGAVITSVVTLLWDLFSEPLRSWGLGLLPHFVTPIPSPRWGDDVGSGLCRCGLHGALYATPEGALCRSCSNLELLEVNP